MSYDLVEGEDMNKFIDVMLQYGCLLYDALVSRHFDGNK